jgi:hypothetical protein
LVKMCLSVVLFVFIRESRRAVRKQTKKKRPRCSVTVQWVYAFHSRSGAWRLLVALAVWYEKGPGTTTDGLPFLLPFTSIGPKPRV